MDNVVERSIRQRGNSFQVDITRDGKRLTTTCKSLEDARKKRAELQHRLYTDDGVLELEGRRLFDSTINRHLAALSRIMTIAMDRGGLDAKPKMPRSRRLWIQETCGGEQPRRGNAQSLAGKPDLHAGQTACADRMEPRPLKKVTGFLISNV